MQSAESIQNHVDASMWAVMTMPISTLKFGEHARANPHWIPRTLRSLDEDGLQSALAYMRNELLSLACDFPEFEIQFREKAMACFEIEAFVTHLCNTVQRNKENQQRTRSFDEIPRHRAAYEAAKLEVLGRAPSSSLRGTFALKMNTGTKRVEIVYYKDELTVCNVAEHMLNCKDAMTILQPAYPQLEEALRNVTMWSAWVVPDCLSRIES